VPDVKVAANGVTMGGVVTNNLKVVGLTQNKELIGDKYTITGTVTVQYTPTANDLQEDIQVQLAVDYNSEANDNFTVHARSLPSEFVIVTKSGGKWYALNADMSGNDAEKANGYLQVDDIEDPTKATFAPCNTIYTFDGMVDGGNKERNENRDQRFCTLDQASVAEIRTSRLLRVHDLFGLLTQRRNETQGN
jgi:hypothetical protein